MASAIKQKIDEILEKSRQVSNDATDHDGQDESSSSGGVEKGDLIELKSLIQKSNTSDLIILMEQQDISPLFKIL